MPGKTSKKTPKVAKKVAAKTQRKRVAPKAAKPRKAGGKPSARTPDSPTQAIDKHIRDLGDWRGSVLTRMRALIREADPEVAEEWKWQKATSPGTPVWSHDGGICTGESYKQAVKLTFFQGASLQDPSHLFNSSREGHTRRAIDIH